MNEIIPSLLYSLPGNIIQKIYFLQQDYTGIIFNSSVIFNLLINIIIPCFVIIFFYLIGLKIKLFFFKKNEGIIDFFIAIALGYILTATGILILGMLGILYYPVIYIYLILVLTIAIFPANSLKTHLSIFGTIYKEYLKQFAQYKLINIAILGFILIGFLRLIPPETGVDALWYHTDYPQAYLKTHSMMNIDPKGKYYPAVTPTLGDMLYVVTSSISAKESSRFIHFSFYLLSIAVYLLVFKKKYPFLPFAVLLFVTSPVIIRHTSTAYSEFQWLFCWLLAIYIITSEKKNSYERIVLSAILFGGTLATKIWMLPFYGVFITYLTVLNINKNKLKLLKLLGVFTVVAFSIPLLWYVRAFLITGNPLFPAFWIYPDGDLNTSFNIRNLESVKTFIINLVNYSPLRLFYGFENIKSRIINLPNLSPFSIFGVIFIIYTLFYAKRKSLKLKNHSFIIFAIILSITSILINYSYHRFLMPFYSVIVIVLASGLERFINNKYFRYVFWSLYSIFFLYYFINTILVLPYGFEWANMNNYLTRILSTNNSSYYDYNNQFSKLIAKKDLVATYGLWGFYYADFNYIYSEDVFRKKSPSFENLVGNGATKLLILGGDINWLCKTEKLTDCSKNHYKFLSYYKFTTSASSQYLYELKHAK